MDRPMLNCKASAVILRLGYSLFLCVLAASLARAQKPDAVAHARSGFNYEQAQRYNEALYEYNAAIAIDPAYPYPYERIGGMYQRLKNFPLAIQYYEHAVSLDSTFDVYNYYNLGLSFRIVRKYDSAVVSMKSFLSRIKPVNAQDSSTMRDADFWIQFNLGCIAEQAKPKNTSAPVPLTALNSRYDDFGPTLTADGRTLYFTSRRPGTNMKETIERKDYGDDLFVSYRDTSGRWSVPETMPMPLNSDDDEGAASVSADGQTIYYSLCRRPGGMGDCDLYEVQLHGDTWGRPMNLGRAINSPEWDGQPSVTPDGSTIYFSSRRQGSIDGSEDLYVSYRNTDGSWTLPKNLGAPINTRFSERSPFISADGKTLYFSSNGHPGFANHDLFMSRKLDDGTWSVPINLGAPINSFGDDVFPTIPARGDHLIYASQRDDARSDLNLYEAVLPAQFRPGPVTVVAGVVYDAVSKRPIQAEVDVNDLKSEARIAVYHTNSITGKYFIPLGTGKTYGVTAVAPGYVFFSEHYTVPDTIAYREWSHDIYLNRLPDSIYAATHEGENEANSSSGLPNSGSPGTTNGSSNSNVANNRGHQGGIVDTTNGVRPGNVRPGQSETDDDLLKRFHMNGEPTRLNNIFFDFNKATLKAVSQIELRYLTNLMRDHPKISILIAGHTDNVGSDSANLVLSIARANAVRDYLIGQGIDSSRIVTRGFGESKPIATNSTEAGRQINRRVEFYLSYGVATKRP